MVGVALVYVLAVEGMMLGVERWILCESDVEERVMVK